MTRVVHRSAPELSGTGAVVLDVDGTIAGPDHRISPRTQAAMAGIERLGVPVVLATGRSRANVLDVAATVSLRTPGVSCNGAVVQPAITRLTPRATRSMDVFWELSDPEATKWSGISFVFDLLGVDPARAVGLGDGENDVVWMREIGLPVAMGNARPEARAVARATAGHHADEGAASPPGSHR